MKSVFAAVVIVAFAPALGQMAAPAVPSAGPVSVTSQTRPPIGPAPSSCGSKDAGFKVTLDKSQHLLAQPEPGKALIYFIHEAYDGSREPMLLAIDGKWVGANRGYSYFSVSVDPGERHLCAAVQYYDRVEKIAAVLAHLQAEAGKSYFYRTRDYLQLDPMDSDEGKYLIGFYPLSVSRFK